MVLGKESFNLSPSIPLPYNEDKTMKVSLLCTV